MATEKLLRERRSMRSSKNVVKAALGGAIVLAMGVATLFHAESTYAATDFSLNKTSRSILTRQSFDFDVVDAPADAVLSWKSSNEKVATVDGNGVVTGIKKGNVTITCEVTSSGKKQKLTAKVEICKPAVKMEIYNKITELKYGKTYDLNCKLVPATSNDVTTWKSSDPKIATVDQKGVVKALKDGTVTITATTMSGKTDSTKITVYGAPAPTKAPDATATPVPTKAPKPTATPKPTQKPSASKDLEYKFADMTPSGYGYSVAAKGDAVDVTFEGQYQEVQYDLPKIVDMKDCEKLTIKIKTEGVDQGAGVAIKVITTDAVLDEWNNPTPAFIQWGFVSMDAVEYEVPLADLAGKKVSRISFMANDGACSATVYSVKFKMKTSSSQSAAKEVKYSFKDITPSGYGYEAAAKGDAVNVSFNGQYQEVQYDLPKAVDMKDYSKVVIKLATATDVPTEGVAIKVISTDAELDQWNNPTPCHTQWGFVSKAVTEYEIDASLLEGKKISRIAFMANDGACTVTVYDVTFVPKK